MSRAHLVLALLLLGGCGGGDALDAGIADAGTRDGATVDAATAEDAGSVGWPTCAVMSALDRSQLMAPASGSDSYVAPSVSRTDALQAAVAAVLRGETDVARGHALEAGYSICQGSGAEDGLLLFEPLARGAGHARAVVNPSGQALIFEAPHPLFDTNTLAQSVSLFEMLGARALIVSGSHRCAGTSASGCDGSTGACGASAPYLDSDPAHTVGSAFHAIHSALVDTWADAVVISVHGFGQAGVSVSDGTTASVDSGAPAARLARALGSRIAGVTSCNDGAGVPVDVRLCGTTNVQGRQLNGSANACTERSTAGLGRFVHMEQSRAVRDDLSVVVAAFQEAFP